MRIGFVIEHFTTEKGGGGGYAVNLARSFTGAGYEVHVFSSSVGTDSKIVYHKIESSSRRGIKEVDFALKTREALVDVDLDVTLGFSKVLGVDVLRPGGGVHRSWFEHDLKADGSGTKRFLHRFSRNIQPRTARLMQLEKEIYSDPDLRVIAVSKMVADDLRQYYDFPSDRIDVIYNGVDNQRYHPGNKKKFYDDIRKGWGIENEKDICNFNSFFGIMLYFIPCRVF